MDGGDEDVDGGGEEVLPAMEEVVEVPGPLAQDGVVDEVLHGKGHPLRRERKIRVAR